MIDCAELQRHMTEQGYTLQSMAAALGLSARVFARKLETGRFGAVDALQISTLLALERPEHIFFRKE